MELQHIGEPWFLVKRETPVDSKHTAEIRSLLEEIKDGKLIHNQEYYHSIDSCGTAHCIAGWQVHKDAIKSGYTPHYYKLEDYDDCEDDEEAEDEAKDEKDYSLEAESAELAEFLLENNNAASEWLYCEAKWGLTPEEAELLFSSTTTLDQQFELVTALEAGFTLNKPKDNYSEFLW